MTQGYVLQTDGGPVEEGTEKREGAEHEHDRSLR
jgi:hypothetical protein